MWENRRFTTLWPLRPVTGILLPFTHLCLDLSSEFFPSGSPTKTLYAFTYYSIGAVCPVHFIFHELFILIILGEEYNLSNSSLCNFLQPSVTFHLRFKYSPQYSSNILPLTWSNTFQERNSVSFSPQANYTDRETAACQPS
jgi:hypothetical protein